MSDEKSGDGDFVLQEPDHEHRQTGLRKHDRCTIFRLMCCIVVVSFALWPAVNYLSQICIHGGNLPTSQHNEITESSSNPINDLPPTIHTARPITTDPSNIIILPRSEADEYATVTKYETQTEDTPILTDSEGTWIAASAEETYTDSDSDSDSDSTDTRPTITETQTDSLTDHIIISWKTSTRTSTRTETKISVQTQTEKNTVTVTIEKGTTKTTTASSPSSSKRTSYSPQMSTFRATTPVPPSQTSTLSTTPTSSTATATSTCPYKTCAPTCPWTTCTATPTQMAVNLCQMVDPCWLNDHTSPKPLAVSQGGNCACLCESGYCQGGEGKQERLECDEWNCCHQCECFEDNAMAERRGNGRC